MGRYKLLHNRIYRGEITHKDEIYPGKAELSGSERRNLTSALIFF